MQLGVVMLDLSNWGENSAFSQVEGGKGADFLGFSKETR